MYNLTKGEMYNSTKGETMFRVLFVLITLCALGGCATPSTTLQNASGQVVNCSATGGGIIGSAAALSMHSDCVARMEKAGYKQVDKNAVAPKASAEAAKVGLNLPADWEQKPLTEVMVKGGGSVYATTKGADAAVLVSVANREGVTDLMAYVTARRAALEGSLLNPASTEVTRLEINGRHAYRFEVAGSRRGGMKVTYLSTIIEGGQQIGVVNAWTKSSDYAKHKPVFETLASNITGLS